MNLIIGILAGLFSFCFLFWLIVPLFTGQQLEEDAEDINLLLNKGEKARKKEDQNTDPLEHLLHRHE